MMGKLHHYARVQETAHSSSGNLFRCWRAYAKLFVGKGSWKLVVLVPKPLQLAIYQPGAAPRQWYILKTPPRDFRKWEMPKVQRMHLKLCLPQNGRAHHTQHDDDVCLNKITAAKGFNFTFTLRFGVPVKLPKPSRSVVRGLHISIRPAESVLPFSTSAWVTGVYCVFVCVCANFLSLSSSLPLFSGQVLRHKDGHHCVDSFRTMTGSSALW